MVRTTGLKNYSNTHFTNPDVARKIVDHFKPSGACLEPFFGNGSFHQYLPDGSRWCEIDLGVDFFEFNEKVNWIITNPPFSNLTEIYQHAFSIADNVVFLIPISKHFSSSPRINLVREYGGLAEILYVGTGRQIGFDIGFPFAAMHFKKDCKSGSIKETFI